MGRRTTAGVRGTTNRGARGRGRPRGGSTTSHRQSQDRENDVIPEESVETPRMIEPESQGEEEVKDTTGEDLKTVQESDEEAYSYEKITDVLLTNGEVRYHTLWSNGEFTWEVASSFAEDDEIFLDFQKQHKAKIERLMNQASELHAGEGTSSNSRRGTSRGRGRGGGRKIQKKKLWEYVSEENEDGDDLKPRELTVEDFYKEDVDKVTKEAKSLVDPTHRYTTTELLLQQVSMRNEENAGRMSRSKLKQISETISSKYVQKAFNKGEGRSESGSEGTPSPAPTKRVKQKKSVKAKSDTLAVDNDLFDTGMGDDVGEEESRSSAGGKSVEMATPSPTPASTTFTEATIEDEKPCTSAEPTVIPKVKSQKRRPQKRKAAIQDDPVSIPCSTPQFTEEMDEHSKSPATVTVDEVAERRRHKFGDSLLNILPKGIVGVGEHSVSREVRIKDDLNELGMQLNDLAMACPQLKSRHITQELVTTKVLSNNYMDFASLVSVLKDPGREAMLKYRFENGMNYLHKICDEVECAEDSAHGSDRILLDLITLYRTLVDQKDNQGRPPLYYAIKSRNICRVATLLKARPAVNVQCREGRDEIPLLRKAAGNRRMMEMLLFNGADFHPTEVAVRKEQNISKDERLADCLKAVNYHKSLLTDHMKTARNEIVGDRYEELDTLSPIMMWNPSREGEARLQFYFPQRRPPSPEHVTMVFVHCVTFTENNKTWRVRCYGGSMGARLTAAPQLNRRVMHWAQMDTHPLVFVAKPMYGVNELIFPFARFPMKVNTTEKDMADSYLHVSVAVQMVLLKRREESAHTENTI